MPGTHWQRSCLISYNTPHWNRSVHISVPMWCVVGYETGVLWDIWDWSIVRLSGGCWREVSTRYLEGPVFGLLLDVEHWWNGFRCTGRGSRNRCYNTVGKISPKTETHLLYYHDGDMWTVYWQFKVLGYVNFKDTGTNYNCLVIRYFMQINENLSISYEKDLNPYQCMNPIKTKWSLSALYWMNLYMHLK